MQNIDNQRLTLRVFTKWLYTIVIVCITLQYKVIRLARKNVSEMTYFVLSTT